ncbi:RhoGAP domain-containing protein [Hamiltosporidium tvaerminnensis]|uniref:RhoGAP domain-containing protein n=1 Tax=Hamiltosporidium tvaerminnensis TaxID=1176355 RepID=A0A4Q9KVP1_9MICR|nr:Rho GTPase-activating protein 35 [Hamiltosporidium tvaerminnensis]TBT98109.1 RhoGAP domain-containing protein [Hamiltosporidium tvaerminnensis]TBU12225.1 RhoGAP domain-containing protein [Hamiltosporidium tvaerminnensis]
MIGKIKIQDAVNNSAYGDDSLNKTVSLPFKSDELIRLFNSLEKGSMRNKKLLPVHRHLKNQMITKTDVSDKLAVICTKIDALANFKILFCEFDLKYLVRSKHSINKCTSIVKMENIRVINQKKMQKKYCKTSLRALEYKETIQYFYDKLEYNQRKKISSYCRFKLLEKPKKRCDCFLEMLKNIFSFGKNSKIDQKIPINPFIYEIGEHLLANGVETEGIFRISGKASAYRTVPNVLKDNKGYNLNDFSIHDNASIFKAYIREILNGLIPEYICGELIATIKGFPSHKSLYNLVFYSRFCFDEDVRKLIVFLKKMFITIEKHSKYNRMTFENLVKIFTPSLFPNYKHFDITTINTQIEFIDSLLRSDLQEVPLEIMNDIKSN